MGSVQIWIIFFMAFLTSLIAMSITFLSREDLRVLRAIAEGSAGDRRAFDVAANDGAANHAYEGGAEVIPLHSDALETPDDVEQSIADLMDGEFGGGLDSFDREAEFFGGDGDPSDEGHLEEEPDTLEQAVVFRRTTIALMTFLEKALTRFAELGFRLGAGDRFGSNLFVTGACEAMFHAHRLTHSQFIRMLEKALAVTGNGSDIARRLAQRYDEYLLEPQYIGVFQAGADAVTKYVANDDSEDAVEAYAIAIKEWRNPRAREKRYDGPITVLFTDIVGSTKLTQELGDEGAQVIVRAHNSVVRKALKDHGGDEVKHTGDGIMASFAKSASAVESAIDMIAGLEEHNRAVPDLPLHVRIGLNAGEPIAEDNDIFGSTVQMAARICDAAETDKVLVSTVVRDLCGGKNLEFETAGRYAMKGIEEPVALFEPRLAQAKEDSGPIQARAS